MSADTPSLLDLRDLVVRFDTDSGVVHAVNGVSFDIRRGEVLGVVGESGSGKSVTAMSLMGLLATPPARIVSGQVWFDGRDLLRLGEDDMREVRGVDISMIFQDPTSALNPVLSIHRQIDEVLRQHTDLDKGQRLARCLDLLEMVEIPAGAERLDRYPHEFSGGMRQRIMIAMALACGPKLLIADEPTTALDVTTQLQILQLIDDLRRELQMSVLMITHDVGVISRVADRVVVMYAGTVVESGGVTTILEQPNHPYTEALIQSVPAIEKDRSHLLKTIPGRPPDLLSPLTHCPFYERCSYRSDPRCATDLPPLVKLGDDHLLASFYRA